MVSNWLKRLVSRPLAGLLSIALSGVGVAAPDEATRCDAAAYHAAQAAGVPVDVMQALTLTETGRTAEGRLRPWPWAVNIEGQEHWFATRAEALTFAKARLAEGRRSFDLGCFQINYRWHGVHFASVEQMVDPQINAAYAARFLRELYAEFGDWRLAAGAYHSRTPSLATRYAARFTRIRSGLNGAPLRPVEPRSTPQPVPVQVAASPSFYASNPAEIPPAGALGSLASGLVSHQGAAFLTRASGSLF